MRTMFGSGERGLGKKIGITAASTLASVAIVGCATSEATPNHAPAQATVATTVSPSETTVTSVTATPNYTLYRKDHLCDSGTPQPCSEPIRTSQELPTPVAESSVLNALKDTPSGLEIAWPIAGKDTVTIVCQVSGAYQKYFGEKATHLVDVIAVPADNSKANQVALQSGLHENPTWHAEKDRNGQIVRDLEASGAEGTLYGYAAGSALDNGEVFSQLAGCTAKENPAHAPAYSE